jgi:DNA polymerase-1
LRLLFDLETDGLLDTVTKVHSLVIRDVDTKGEWSCQSPIPYSIESGMEVLSRADVLIGHNLLTYDLEVLKKLFNFKTSAKIIDTLVCSRLIWPDTKDVDLKLWKRGRMPGFLIGKHSLEAWGYRLGELKGEFGKHTDWKAWTPEMQEYCEQDVKLNAMLFEKIEKQDYSQEAIDLEHEFQWIIYQQEQFGFRFDEQKAGELYAVLAKRRDALKTELQKTFEPTIIQLKTKTKTIPFNPGSRDQMAKRLKARGWQPKAFTETGKPQVDETILEGIGSPEALKCAEFLMVQKRISQLAEGNEAWMKLCKKGRIHGRVLTNGAVSGRCTHFGPNITQVPGVMDRLGNVQPYGKECRDLFTVDPGYVLVGADASGLELRCLAHFMAKYDDGAYAKILLEGDIHTTNMTAAGLDKRPAAKTWIYRYLYGSGDFKLGNLSDITPEMIEQFRAEEKKRWAHSLKMQTWKKEPTDDLTIATCVKGNLLRTQFEEKTPALAQLKADLLYAYNDRGYIKGIDGRILQVRSKHSILNLLLQSAGAIVVKKGTSILHGKLTKEGLKFGPDYGQVAHAHDELEIQSRPELAEHIGLSAVQSFKEAGEHFRFRCPLSGEFRIGKTWAEVH